MRAVAEGSGGSMVRWKRLLNVKRQLSLRLSDNYSSLSMAHPKNTVVVDFFLFGSFSFFVKSCEFL